MRDTKFATELRERRKARGLTQAQVASLCDVSTVTVWNWEKGRSAPWSKDQAKILLTIGEAKDVSKTNTVLQSGRVEPKATTPRETDVRRIRTAPDITSPLVLDGVTGRRRLIDNFGDIKC